MADGDAPLAKRTPLTMILKLVATVIILALVVYSLDLEKLSGALSAIDWHWLLRGSLASALFVSLRIIKWRELTRRNGMNASGKEIARTALLGLAVGLITPVRLGELVGVAISLPLAFIPFLRVSSRHLMMRNETKSALASEPRRSQCQSIALKAPESFSRSSEYTTSARMTTVATSFRIMVRGGRLARGASPSAMAKLHLELRLGFPGVDRLGHSQHRSLGEGRPRQARRRTGDRELGENHIRRERVFTVPQHIGSAHGLAI